MAARSRRKKNNDLHRSGFLLMFFVLVILGSVIYFYRDRFFVLFDTGVSSGKKMMGLKSDDKNKKKAFELMDFIEGLNKDKGVEKVSEKENDVPHEKIVSMQENQAERVEKKEQKESVKEEREIERKVKQENNESKANNEIVEKKTVKSEPVIVKKKPVVKKTVQETAVKKENPVAKSVPKKTYVPKNTATVKKETKSKSDSVKLSKIYFSQFDEASGIKLVSAYRKIDYGNAPLTAVLTTLLKGPTSDEMNKNVITNVPSQTVLKSVKVENGIAYINLSAEFENNPYGKESTVAQLKQIVFTATEFRNITAVQFLINGKIKSYLGGEGIQIGKPLSRNDFT